MNYKQIIDFWFNEVTAEQKFKKDLKFDQYLKNKFSLLHAAIIAGEKEDWRQTPEGTLAYILVIDQFSRNMFRDQPEGFAYDQKALTSCLHGIEQGFDKSLPEEQRSFFYMPMMHSEDREMHEKALDLFRSLGGHSFEYEIAHKKIIDRFGRYPHRNVILGRKSSAEELAFLKEDSSSF
ncbi:hypothetical protein COB57_00770 [Candidatus Peregrinibacteria bacterium]|nr:MAG: hypothetical protein COB57_00770 [Candidatus Peregrinibacteria bacterium]